MFSILGLFLVVSCITLVLQFLAFIRVLVRHAGSGIEGKVSAGYLRTIMCRVAAATAYVVLAAVQVSGRDSLAAALAVFTSVQALWLLNSLSDIRLQESFTDPDGDDS